MVEKTEKNKKKRKWKKKTIGKQKQNWGWDPGAAPEIPASQQFFVQDASKISTSKMLLDVEGFHLGENRLEN